MTLFVLLLACRTPEPPLDPAEPVRDVVPPGVGWDLRFQRFVDDPYDGDTGGMSVRTLAALRTPDAWELGYVYSYPDTGGLTVAVYPFVRHHHGSDTVELSALPVTRDQQVEFLTIGHLAGEPTPAFAFGTFDRMVVHHGGTLQSFSAGIAEYGAFGAGHDQLWGAFGGIVTVFDLRDWRNLSHRSEATQPSLCPVFLDDGSLAVLERSTFTGVVRLLRPGTTRDLIYPPPSSAYRMEVTATLDAPLLGADWRCHATGTNDGIVGSFSDGSVVVRVRMGHDGTAVAEAPVSLDGTSVVGLLTDGRVVVRGETWVGLLDDGPVTPLGPRPLVLAGSFLHSVHVSNDAIGAAVHTPEGPDVLLSFVAASAIP